MGSLSLKNASPCNFATCCRLAPLMLGSVQGPRHLPTCCLRTVLAQGMRQWSTLGCRRHAWVQWFHECEKDACCLGNARDADEPVVPNVGAARIELQQAIGPQVRPAPK